VEEPKQVRSQTPFPIVGVGASAGGLKALEGFFSKIPADTGVSFVVIQHMDPVRKSMLAQLLSKATSMLVTEIEDGVTLKENRVYVTPPNRYITIMERRLFLIEPEDSHSLHLPIDHFFTRLSEELAERAIGIVLSGTGSDGTLGIKAIKGVGGLTIAQQEDQAEHSGMPASAIASGYVDVVTEAEKMHEHIYEFLHHPYASREKETLSAGEANLNVPKILNLIRTRTGNDFSKYNRHRGP
jgi:two-component system CheB/CheR fusion protein